MCAPLSLFFLFSAMATTTNIKVCPRQFREFCGQRNGSGGHLVPELDGDDNGLVE
jgi:hypothetical protein